MKMRLKMKIDYIVLPYIGATVYVYGIGSTVLLASRGTHPEATTLLSAQNSTSGINLSGNLTIHFVQGGLWGEPDFLPRAQLATYAPFAPVIARYRIPIKSRGQLQNLISELEFDTNLGLDLFKISSFSEWVHGSLNTFTGRLNNPRLRKMLWEEYIGVPLVSEDAVDFGGHAYYFPPPGEETQLFNSDSLYTIGNIRLIAFITFDLTGLEKNKQDYLVAVVPDSLMGCRNLQHIDKARTARGSAKTLLVPALNTPMIPYSG
jgi:hypothetical protein